MVRKKEQHHFRVVSRSAKDPLKDLEGATQSVLVPFVPANEKKKGRGLGAPGADLGLSADVFGIHENLGEGEREDLQAAVFGEREEPEIEGECYFPTDGYDYEKHLKPIGLTGGHLFDAPEGFLAYVKRNKMSAEEQAAQDALEADEGYEEADEGFFDGLLAEVAPELPSALLWGGLPAALPEAERGEADSALDALLGEYAPDQLGALDSIDEAEVCGRKDLAAFDGVLDEHLEAPIRAEERYRGQWNTTSVDVSERTRECLAYVEDEEYVTVEAPVAPQFDCESVLSMRSNVSNHPGRVVRPERPPRAPRPIQEAEEEDAVELPAVVTLRPRGEAPEERKTRKAAVKEHNKLCREMKKATKEAFKEEAKKAKARPTAGDLRDGVRVRAI